MPVFYADIMQGHLFVSYPNKVSVKAVFTVAELDRAHVSIKSG